MEDCWVSYQRVNVATPFCVWDDSEGDQEDSEDEEDSEEEGPTQAEAEGESLNTEIFPGLPL